MTLKNPLLDDIFLRDLYKERHKEIYVKIIALDKDENAIEEIEGQVTGGSISLDGTSNVRRSCNLTMVTNDIDINAYYWGFKNKFKLYIGLNNQINTEYDSIIWFPMGIFIITSFNTALSANSYTINISGKDKMCLLNGDLSGSVFAMIDFGKEEVYDTKTKVTTINDIPVKTIIREAVHEYAGEPWENIIINDLEDIGLELLDYKGTAPLYLLIRDNGSNEDLSDVALMTLNGRYQVIPVGETNAINISDDSIDYNPRSSLDLGYNQFEPTHVTIPSDASGDTYTIAKVEYGQTCGYRYTDITYAGDLILNVGESITSMLDKLVAMLGNWEYFYDVNGRFIFQRKKTYLDKTWNNIITGNDDSYVPTMHETYAESAMWSSAVSWNFTDGFLVTAFNNAPVLNNVKNDYSIWGTRQSISGTDLPVHLRYAIDKKPTYYRTIAYSEEKIDDDGNRYTIYHPSITWTTDGSSSPFVLQHENDLRRIGLTVPVLNENTGVWSPGWWDIRDWYEYYLRYTGKVPREPMRYYSHNDTSGSISVSEMQANLTENIVLDNNLQHDQNTNYIWLLLATPNNQTNQIELSASPGHITSYPEHTYANKRYYITYLTNEEYERQLYQDHFITESGNLPSQIPITVNSQVIATSYLAEYYDVNTDTYQTVKEFHLPMGLEDNENTILYLLISQMGITQWDETTKMPVGNGNGNVVYIYNPTFPEKPDAMTEADFMAQLQEKSYKCDWREIIFQMAKDYRRHMHEDSFLIQLRDTNGKNSRGEWYYPAGKTGYEQYYTDLEGFWRQLYCPPQLLSKWYATGVWTDRDQAGRLYQNGTGQIWSDVDINPYSISSLSNSNSVNIVLDNATKTNLTYFLSTSWVENGYADDKSGWNKQIIDAPATLNFWFDFLSPDDDSDFARYSVPAIGDRAKSVNDDNVKAIYFREIPNTIFTDDLQNIERKSGYTYLQYQPSMARLFNISTQGKCTIDVLEEWLNNYVYAVESVNMTTVPIYHLQPNTRIQVMDMNSKINGQYIVSRISIPLAFNGTMSITATKVADRVY